MEIHLSASVKQKYMYNRPIRFFKENYFRYLFLLLIFLIAIGIYLPLMAKSDEKIPLALVFFFGSFDFDQHFCQF